MAYLADDEKQQQPGQDQSSAPGQINPGDSTNQGASALSTAPDAGGNFVSGGSPVSTAGIGSGGTGGWTNIQSYLMANPASQGTATALKSQVGSTFDQEKQNIDKSSQDTQSQAQQNVNQNSLSTDQATKLLQQAGSNYSYSGTPSDTYSSSVGQLKNAYGAQYSGPTNWSYGLGADAQNYGQGLQNDEGFHGIMNTLYNKAAGGTMGSGAQSLQQQLDQDNPYLNQARSDLQSQWNGLAAKDTGYLDSTTAQTNQALQNAQSQFTQNQGQLKTMLSGAADQDKGAIASQIKKDQDFLQNNSGNTQDPNSTVWGTFDKSSGPNESNVAGVDSQRNEWNAIQDVMSNNAGKYNYQGPWDFNNAHWNLSTNPAFGNVSLASSPNVYGSQMSQELKDAFNKLAGQQSG